MYDNETIIEAILWISIPILLVSFLLWPADSYNYELTCVRDNGDQHTITSSNGIYFNGHLYTYDNKSYTPYEGEVCEISKVEKPKD